MKRFLLIVMMVFFAAACAKSGNDSGLPKHVLRLNLGAEPSTLNPILVTDSASHGVTAYIFSGLFKKSPDLEMEPDLVEHFDVSDDGLTYTFYLREDVVWHDGEPFTADDVVFTFEKILDPNTNTVRRSHYIIEGAPVRWRAKSKTVVEAYLPRPYAPFLTALTMGILPRHLLLSEDINTTAFNRSPIGTGPFKFGTWASGQYVQLQRHEAYYKGAPKLASLILKIIPDVNTALAALANGELDIAGLPAKDIPRFKDKSYLTVHSYYTLSYSYMGMNLDHDILGNPLVRQALDHAINKQAMVNGILKGYGQPAYIPSSPVSWAYPDEDRIHKRAYDPERARQLLEVAGYDWDEDAKLFYRDGEPLTLEMMISKGSVSTQKMAQIIQRFLLDVGVSLRIRIVEWPTFLKILYDKQPPKNFDLVLSGWSFDINDPDDTFTSWHSSAYPRGSNVYGYQNPGADALLEAGRIEMDRSERKLIYEDLFNTIARDAPSVFLFHSQANVAVNKRLSGLSKPGPGGLLNRVHEVDAH